MIISAAGILSQGGLILLMASIISINKSSSLFFRYGVYTDPNNILLLLFIVFPPISLTITIITYLIANHLGLKTKVKNSNYFSHWIWIGLGGIIGELPFWVLNLNNITQKPLTIYYMIMFPFPLIVPLILFIVVAFFANVVVREGYLDKFDLRFIIIWLVATVICLGSSELYSCSIIPIIILIFFIAKYLSTKAAGVDKRPT